MRIAQQTAKMALLTGAAVALQGCIAAAVPLAAGGLIGERQISRGNSNDTSTDDAALAAAPTINPVVEVEASTAPNTAPNTASQQPTNSDLAAVEPAASALSARAPALPETPQELGQFGRAPDLVGPSLPPAEPITSTTPPPTVAIVRSGAAQDASDGPRVPAPMQSDLAQSPSAPPAVNEVAPTPPAITPQTVELAAGTTGTRPLPTPIPSAREPLAQPAAAIPPSQSPAPITGQPSGQPRTGLAGINQLLSYANSRQIGSEETPVSAMLQDRIALTPERAECSGISPTVLIDLDPEGGLFDSKTASRPPSGLARGLNQLRLNGISIAWISGNGIDQIDAITRALRYSGLDLNNEDRVLLVRGSDDRKQALREELSQISCLIAIAGDTRSDFDELYDYLKNPADAQSLEPIIGDGWFLIPQPLISAGSE